MNGIRCARNAGTNAVELRYPVKAPVALYMKSTLLQMDDDEEKEI